MLSVEPWGMKLETIHRIRIPAQVSVLSVEPWGMKRVVLTYPGQLSPGFSALGRAVGDETTSRLEFVDALQSFQCSRSSRGG